MSVSQIKQSIARTHPTIVRTNLPTRLGPELQLQLAARRVPEWTKLVLFFHRC